MKDAGLSFFVVLMTCCGIIAWNAYDIDRLKHENMELKVFFDKRISGNAIAADAALNKAEENAEKIREILEKCKCPKP